MHIAVKTLQAFHAAVTHDQGAAFRQHLQRVLPHIGDAYRGEEEAFRNHLGASGIGKDCGRAIWYSHRWATKPHFEGRMIRLFNRGHLEEGRMIALLLTIGVQVFQQDESGKQFRISYFGGHYGGSGDGVVIGIPDLEAGQAGLNEYKTHSDKYFTKIAGKSWDKYHDYITGQGPAAAFDGVGVREGKFEHWIQMQAYMRKMGLAVGVYFAVNKDNDHIYAEIVPLDALAADKMVERAETIINASSPPPMINKSPGWKFPCSFCDHYGVCKNGKTVERNCRTCRYSKPYTEGPDAGKWICEQSAFPEELSKDEQLKGCALYDKNPTM